MPTTRTILFAPPLRHSEVPVPLQKWLLTLQNLHPMVEVDTSSGDVVETLPLAGLDQTTGQSNQNVEYVYTKTSADVNTVTINGAASGPVVLTAQHEVARFKSNGTVWRKA